MDARPVRPRALGELLTRPVGERHGILAEGLAHLVEHIEALRISVASLSAQRGRAILEHVMGEEAAKILIILDIVRGGWRNQKEAKQRLDYFSEHFVRGIYQRVTSINPGSFGEVRDYVERLRPEFYLDGPNDADWVFRNEIESSRELAFYVDYVKEETDYRWVSPGEDNYRVNNWDAQATADLALAMGRVGLLTEAGLAIVARTWRETTPVDSTTFAEHFELTAAVMGQLIEGTLYQPTATQADFQSVAEHWPFPLNSLELGKIPVSGESLGKQRAAIEEAFWRGEYGPLDY